MNNNDLTLDKIFKRKSHVNADFLNLSFSLMELYDSFLISANNEKIYVDDNTIITGDKKNREFIKMQLEYEKTCERCGIINKIPWRLSKGLCPECEKKLEEELSHTSSRIPWMK